MEAFLTPGYQPFAFAAAVLFGLVLLEIASVVIGASFSTTVDSFLGEGDVGGEAPGLLGNGLAFLNAGRVPLIVLMMIVLSLFTTTGVILQFAASAVWAPLPATPAALVALVASLPLTRWTSRLIARVIPQDETYAVEDEHFIGRMGVVTVGPVQEGAVARIKIQDQWGNWHFPRVRPATRTDVLPNGTNVLVIDRIGRELTVIGVDAEVLGGADAA
jgi:membrane protein implicated in regulation of membrane protease activity